MAACRAASRALGSSRQSVVAASQVRLMSVYRSNGTSQAKRKLSMIFSFYYCFRFDSSLVNLLSLFALL